MLGQRVQDRKPEKILWCHNSSVVPQREEIGMTDEVRGVSGEKPDPEAVGEVDAMNWACTVCGYSVEGELPKTCPDCGADKEDFESVPRIRF